MKATLRISLLLSICLFLFSLPPAIAQDNTKTETFKVYGNCEMCKANIEGALKKKEGVLKKSWSPATKMLTVTYDSSRITLSQIKQKITAVGYDTDEFKGDDVAYGKLHTCCKYERAKK